jgi:hypothetical protein
MFTRNIHKPSFQMLLLACLTSTLCAANDPFTGDWKLNPSKSQLTDVMKVESAGANKYTFDFGGGPETIAADGTDQLGGYGTTLCVTVEGQNRWKVVRKKDGRMLITATWTLSEDGSTLTDDYHEFEPNGSTFNLKYLYKRTAGGSGFADRWVSTSETGDIETLVYSLQIRPYEQDGLSFVYPSRESTQNVKFDGKDYPRPGQNAPEGSTFSARRVSDRAFEMTYKVKGKVIFTQDVEISPDLKTLTMTRHNAGQSEPLIQVFDRQ